MSAQGKPYVLRGGAKLQFGSGQCMFLGSGPAFELLLTRGGGFASGMAFEPDQEARFTISCVGGTFA